MTDQSRFRAALLDPARPAPDGLCDGAARPAGRRFDVYRNNVAVSLTEALRSGFPVLTKLLGRQNMDGLAGLFLRAHPPSSPLMMHYGAALPGFITALPQLPHLGYLPDVARLELALRGSYHAADSAPIDPDILARTDPEDLMAARLTLAPAAILVRSEWPIFDIWRYNTQEGAPKPRAGAQDVLIVRPDFDPEPHLLAQGGGAFVAAVQAGAPFGAAQDAALADAPEFDLAAILHVLLTGRALISLNSEAS
jgi:hypothetical protein